MFHRAVNWVKQKRWTLASILSVVCVVSLLDVGVTVRNNPSSSLSSTDNTIGIGVGNELVITLGHVAYAAGSVDYTYDGTDDNVQFQAALDALPATGGRLVDVSAVQKNFAATVTRAIPNVTIEGTGAGSYFTNNGATALFTAGGNGWKFSDLKVDYTGGLNMGATTDWMFINVTEDTDYYAFRTSDDITAESIAIPTGRTATYVVAASDAPDHVKAQADYVCDGTADNVEIQAAIDALPVTGGTLTMLGSTYVFAATVTRAIPNVIINGEGVSISYDAATPLFLAGGDNWVLNDLVTDAGGLDMGITSGWLWQNVTLGTDRYAIKSPDTSFSSLNLTNDDIHPKFSTSPWLASEQNILAWTSPENDENQTAVTIDDNYIYLVQGYKTFDVVTHIYKIDKKTLTTVDEWSAGATEINPHYIYYDGTYMYISILSRATDTDPGKVIKFNPATMTAVSTWTGAVGQHQPKCIVGDGTYIYNNMGYTARSSSKG